jgi:SPX domain protein involved in polyphosphate accumulation
MKFCRNLQRVIDITDPEWAPYWTNYKMLKKFLKNLPSFVPPDGAAEASSGSGSASRAASPDSCVSEGETPAPPPPPPPPPPAAADWAVSEDVADEKEAREEEGSERESVASNETTKSRQTTATKMSRNPGEVAFFRLLNSELRKAIHFFDKAQLEFEIREARVREGIDIMRKANSLMVSEKWTLMAKSLYRLYKDLLLLETFAIMTYCSFSKILKKHDKVTSHNTRMAFMKNVVNKANFTHYPKLLVMISRCENLYEEVSQSLIQVSAYNIAMVSFCNSTQHSELIQLHSRLICRRGSTVSTRTNVFSST